MAELVVLSDTVAVGARRACDVLVASHDSATQFAATLDVQLVALSQLELELWPVAVGVYRWHVLLGEVLRRPAAGEVAQADRWRSFKDSVQRAARRCAADAEFAEALFSMQRLGGLRAVRAMVREC